MEKLIDYVRVYDNLISHRKCDEILEYCKECPWDEATTVGGDNDYRACSSHAVQHDTVLDDILYDVVNDALIEYCSEFHHFKCRTDSGYTLLRYVPGNKYEVHTDQYMDYNREVTIIINLTDDYEGGDLSMFDGQYDIKLEKGNVVIFPSNFMFPHAIRPIVSGTRYSVVSWAV